MALAAKAPLEAAQTWEAWEGLPVRCRIAALMAGTQAAQTLTEEDMTECQPLSSQGTAGSAFSAERGAPQLFLTC
jgi:hypothetical protein